MTPVYQSHGKMSGEERTLKNIFQMSNNKIIQCIKSSQYRDVIVAYWNANSDNRLASISAETTWNMKTMKAMVMAMISTTYNVMFQRLPAKAACDERTERFMNITKNYRKWFQDTKSMASDAYVAQYEADLKAKAIKADQFAGMIPGMYTVHDPHNNKDSAVSNTEPVIGRHTRGTTPGFLSLALNGPENGTDHSEALLKLQGLVTALTESSESDRQKMEAAKLTLLRLQFQDPATPKTWEKFLGDPALSPITKKVAISNQKDLCVQSARWGQDEDSFTARLAKLQDW
jgi:hypothetical protein